MDEGDSMLREADLAARWGVTRGHLRNLRSEGEGPRHLKVPRVGVRYLLSEVKAYELASRAG